MNEKLRSEQQHTIPRWLLENFTDGDGMLHAARKSPRTFFRSKPRNVFRRRDYYAAKEIGVSLETAVTKTEQLFIPYVESVLGAARKGIDHLDLSCMGALADDVRTCGLLLTHLSYRSPQWLGEDFFLGIDAIRIEAEKAGKDMGSLIREESTRLWQAGEFVLVFSQVDAPNFVMGDCGPFLSRDAELGVGNQKRKRNAADWVPADRRIWMALSSQVALGIAMREAVAHLTVDVLPNTELSEDWMDHFNEICTRHSETIVGASERWVRTASRKAWPVD